MLVLGTDDLDFSSLPFHGLQASPERTYRSARPRVARVLTVTVLARPAQVDTLGSLCPVSQKRQRRGLRCRTYKVSTGVLTSFPFTNTLQLGARLGPTNPSLTFIGKEPLPFRRRRFSLRSVLTIARILIPARFTHARGRAFAHAGRLPTPHLAVGCSIGCRFSPVHFQHPHP